MYILIILVLLLVFFLAQRQVEGFCDCQNCSQPCNCVNCPYRQWLGRKSVSYEGFTSNNCTGEVECQCSRCLRLRHPCGRYGYRYM